MFDGKGLRDGLGHHVKIELQGIKLFKRQSLVAGNKAHDDFLGQKISRPARQLKMKRNNHINQINIFGCLFKRNPTFIPLEADEFLALFLLVETDHLPLLRREQTFFKQKINQFIVVEKLHIVGIP